ncbi:MAG: RecQ family ATP-dependent DNA helicase [Nanobdellota archaeon]
MPDIDRVLKVFGFDAFRPGQRQIIEHVLKGEDVLAIMPTGSGKSLCFQLPAVMQDTLTIVVSPLISLMKDQVDALQRKGVNACYFNSSLDEVERHKVFDMIESIDLLYIAPESLKTDTVLNQLPRVGMVVVDEAHCISTWGQNFRPDYLRLGYILKRLGDPMVLAITATATKRVENDICSKLGREFRVFRSSFDRGNLYLEVVSLEDAVDKVDYLHKVMDKFSGPTIIFVSYQKTAENIAGLLNEKGFSAAFFHAGMDKEKKRQVQDDFLSGKTLIIVATIAFGMGIDKPDIRNVIHFNLPQSIENYYQEIGRAGRDGQVSNCVALVTPEDQRKIKRLLSMSWPDRDDIRALISYLQGQEWFFSSVKKIAFDLVMEEIPVNLILYSLERNGAIKVYSNVLHEVKLSLEADIPTILQHARKDYIDDLKLIFSDPFFSNNRMKWFSLDISLNYFRVKELILYLTKGGYASIEDERRKTLFRTHQTIKTFDIEPVADYFDRILAENMAKVDKLVESLEASACIRGQILKYFDESLENCRFCSGCCGRLITADITPSIDPAHVDTHDKGDLLEFMKDDSLETTILKIIANWSLNSRDIIPVLGGTLKRNHAKWKFRLPFFGMFKDTDGKRMEAALDKLKNGFVRVDIDGMLRITPKGMRFLVDG